MEKKKFSTIAIANGALLLTMSSAIAQNSDTLKVQKLNEIVISATRTEQNPIDVGRSITVVSSDQIKKSGANSVAEILSMQEGIYIVGTGANPGQLQNIFLRGSNSNQAAIMVDGVRLTDPSATDNAIDLSELSLLDIERIEIVRGSHSTLYGSSAIGGVINFITSKQTTPGVHVVAETKAGEFGKGTSTFSQNVLLNYTHKSGLYATAGVYNNTTKGLDATVDTSTNPKDYKHNHRDKDAFKKMDLLGKIGYRTAKLDAFASYKSIKQIANIDKGAFNDDDNYTVDFKRNLFNYGANYKINEKFALNYLGGITDLTRIATDDSSKVDEAGVFDHNYFKGTYKGKTLTNELQAVFKNKGVSVVAGGTAFDERMTFNTYYYSGAFGVYESKQNLDSINIKVKTISEFVHLNLDGSLFNDKYKMFAIALGVRNSKHDLFGNNLTYEINPSIKLLDNGILYASYSTGFNAPSLYQLYSPEKDPSGITRGNPTLKPETSTSWEFGFKHRVNDNIWYSIAYFKTIIENSIDYVYIWNNSKSTDSLKFSDYKGDTYMNIGKQTTQGIEISIFSKINDKLSISANTSLVSGKLDYSPSNIDNSHVKGNQIQLFANGAFITKDVSTIGLVRRPSTTNLTASYKLTKKLSVAGAVRYVGSRSDIYYNSALGPFGSLANKGIGDYTLVDLHIGYEVMKHLSAAIRVENIFNEKYYEIYGYTTRGRGVYLSLKYTL